MNPYSILGVPHDADAETIKAAWRRRSSAAHPDREGGSDAAQAQVNEAYAILSDPARRERYDLEGRTDVPKGLEHDAQAMLLQILAAALEQEEMPIVARARAQVEFVEVDLLAQIEAATRRQARLQKQRRTVRASAERNLVHGLIDQQVAACVQGVETLQSNLAIIRRAGEMLEVYADEEQLPTYRPLFGSEWGDVSLGTTSA